MPFSPYHHYSASAKLVRLIEKLKNENHISEEDYFAFHRYHLSSNHKLKSAKYHLIKLMNKLTNVDIQEVVDPSGSFLFETNLYIDGYFYNCGSALDILAREMLVLFGESLPDRIYFHTAHELLSISRPGDSILSRTERPSWKKEFSAYRNALTHELLLAAQVSVTFENRGPNQTHMVVLPLPDDPRIDIAARTYNRNKNVLDYIEENFKRVLRLINGVYNEVYTRARDNNALPL